ncbi:MAG: TetR/AcrR family transcriptional regulator [Glaciihabitans sp.]|nr:TetR/AcrR family transcriptional regulator [Glaciihabitans sp.]
MPRSAAQEPPLLQSQPIDGVRLAMGQSSDTKVARTRQAIVAAVTELVHTNAGARGNTAVTVSDVVRQAGISRSAFYTHFSGLDELAMSILRDSFTEISTSDLELRRTSAASPGKASRIGITRMVEHVLEHRALYLGVLGLPQSSRAYEAAVEEFALHVSQTTAVMPNVPVDVDVEDAALFIASGTMSLVVRWMRSSDIPPTEEMVRRLVALMPTWLVPGD